MSSRFLAIPEKKGTAKGAVPASRMRQSARTTRSFFQHPDPGSVSAARSFSGGRFLVQPKLTISRPDDQYEQEADRVADQVMRMPESAAGSQQPGVNRASGMIQTKPG